MNYVVVSGKVHGEIIKEYKENTTMCKFKVKNIYFSPSRQNNEVTYIRCIAYGSLAEYCNNELYEGEDVIITGRIHHRYYKAEGKDINMFYIACNTVSRLEQEEYN